ncbi:MAG: hypothetical protein JW870_08745 [Candidatus Delongbacteria bacterium]|nr:hypothetical protein [Candidatus Delongbacteria bacterium]
MVNILIEKLPTKFNHPAPITTGWGLLYIKHRHSKSIFLNENYLSIFSSSIIHSQEDKNIFYSFLPNVKTLDLYKYFDYYWFNITEYHEI